MLSAHLRGVQRLADPTVPLIPDLADRKAASRVPTCPKGENTIGNLGGGISSVAHELGSRQTFSHPAR